MTMRKRPTKRTLTAIIITGLLLILASIFFAGSFYKEKHFGDAKIDEIIFYFNNGWTNSDMSSTNQAIFSAIILAIIPFIIFMLPLIIPWKKLAQKLNQRPLFQKISAKIPQRLKQFNTRWRHRIAYVGALFLWGLFTLLSAFHVPSYVVALTQTTTIFEEHYVDPATVAVQFPEKKRNLIRIYLESVENTLFSKTNGGAHETSIMPELESLAIDQNNISFSHTASGLGGMLPATGTTWTIAGLTAQTAGIPLKDGFGGKDRNELGQSVNRFIPGAYTSGQILQKAGYNRSFVMGSESSFGGRDKLLSQHGDYKIIDFPYVKKVGKLSQDYKVWWGYEDKKLFEYAKEEATELARKGQPFDLELLTVDTHYTDGYLDETCPRQYTNHYDSVHACSSKQVAAFVEWVKQQPFYENTTIVITGDHLGMNTAHYNEKIAGSNYQRSVYNVIINSAAQADNSRTKNRQFTSFDMYPTTLAAIGAKIPGERLGLGVNLFSPQATLTEKMGGIDALNAELSKRSEFYDRRIFQGKK